MKVLLILLTAMTLTASAKVFEANGITVDDYDNITQNIPKAPVSLSSKSMAK